MEKIPPERFKRDAPYASIRVSFHPEKMSLKKTIEDTLKLSDAKYQIGIWMVDHPKYKDIKDAMKVGCKIKGIDFRLKEFLGKYEGRLYGTYKYPEALSGNRKRVLCRGTELLVAPDGNIYKCHGDLYSARNPLGNISNKEFKIEYKFRECENFGLCSPCDVKLKNNRFQEFGHCAVEIKEC
jgi:hypothetical protein